LSDLYCRYLVKSFTERKRIGAAEKLAPILLLADSKIIKAAINNGIDFGKFRF